MQNKFLSQINNKTCNRPCLIFAGNRAATDFNIYFLNRVTKGDTIPNLKDRSKHIFTHPSEGNKRWGGGERERVCIQKKTDIF